MHYYQFNIADYQSHTKHLTPIEDICYRRLLDWQYLHEKPIPNDLKSMCRLLMLRDYHEDVEQVLNEFFVLTGEGWVNPRAFEEIDEYLYQQEKNNAREENEKERKRRHREERKQLFADLREKGVIPGWRILTEPLRELHKLHCGKSENYEKTIGCEELLEQGHACDEPVTERGHACDEPGTAITINQEPLTINQEPLTTHTPATVPNSNQARPEPTPAARVCRELRNLGFGETNPAHPLLLELLNAGATVDEFVYAGKEAKKKGKDFKYILGIVKGQRAEALAASKQILHGDISNKSPPKKTTPQRENFHEKDYGEIRSL